MASRRLWSSSSSSSSSKPPPAESRSDKSRLAASTLNSANSSRAMPQLRSPAAQASHRIPQRLQPHTSSPQPSRVLHTFENLGEPTSAATTPRRLREPQVGGKTQVASHTHALGALDGSGKRRQEDLQPLEQMLYVPATITPNEPSGKQKTLRRKPSVIARFVSERRDAKAGPVKKTQEQQPPLPSRVPTPLAAPRHSSTQPPVPPELQALASARSAQNVTPLSNPCVTPPLTHSETLSVFSHSTTPLSRTSYSPHTDVWSHSAGRSPAAALRFVSQESNIDTVHREHPFFSADTVDKPATTTVSKVAPSLRNPQPLSKPARIAPSSKASDANLAKRYVKTDTPPELAHLLDDGPRPQQHDTQQRAPKRPSRDGTPNLSEFSSPTFPVVESNLTRLPQREPVGQRMAGGSATDSAPLASPDSKNPGPPSGAKRSTKLVKPRSVPITPSTSIPSAEAGHQTHSKSSSEDSERKPVAKSTSRFGFFSRKQKTPDKPSSGKPEIQKKGPAAGTGHEGYGRHHSVRRGSSSSSNSGIASSVQRRSVSSTKSGSSSRQDQPLDDFLQQRLSPVFIRGDAASAAVSPSSLVSPDTAISTGFASPKSSHSSQFPDGSADLTRPSKKLARLVTTDLAQHSTVNSAEILSGSSMASSQPPSSVFDGDRSRTLKYGSGSTSAGQQTSRPQDASRVATLQTPVDLTDNTESHFSDYEDRPKSRKGAWSLFPKSVSGKAQQSKQTASPKKHTPQLGSPMRDVDTLASRQALAPQRSFAHYELFNNRDPIAFEELESIMQEADTAFLERRHNSTASTKQLHIDLTDPSNFAKTLERPPALSADVLHGYTGGSTQPSLASLKAAEEALMQQQQQQQQQQQLSGGPPMTQLPALPKPKGSRLPQVGRIPRVVSKRDHERKMPEQSFSRPFTSDGQRPSFHREQQTEPANFAPGPLDIHNILSKTSSTYSDASAAQPFISFSPRKGSQVSNSTGSSTVFLPSLPWIATDRPLGSPPSADEVWTEYDELLDNVLTPTGSNQSPMAATGAPQRSDYFSTRRLPQLKDALTPDPLAIPRTVASARDDSIYVPSDTSTLYPSRLASIQEQPSAVTSPSISKFVDVYADGSNDSWAKSRSDIDRPDSQVPPLYSPSIYSPRASGVLSHRRSTSLPQTPARESARSSGSSSGSRSSLPVRPNPQSMANLRFGALMVSKWLSFGRVLVSPIHFDLYNGVQGRAEDRILVIDGLGKDWSYYCALTYADVQVYNVGPGDNGTQTSRGSIGSSFKSLPNHRHIIHEDLTIDLPFPQHFFSVVVFRFPAALSEAALKTVLMESKRVLKPGGYLEISTLDLDLTNMGHLCRKTVRNLKIKLTAADRSVSLKPASDDLQLQLGRRGFENISRCVVAVPAAGTISSGSEDSPESKDVSITELMKDQSPEGDDHITKMVAKVGRWWYSRCYESGLLPDGDFKKSIWNDAELLRECEEHATAFKLLICYAQKPFAGSRRAQSL